MIHRDFHVGHRRLRVPRSYSSDSSQPKRLNSSFLSSRWCRNFGSPEFETPKCPVSGFLEFPAFGLRASILRESTSPESKESGRTSTSHPGLKPAKQLVS